ncbi:MAG TPA: glycosyltransferase [Alphaproteobacteria bacterium]|nr:glycosyltransferase [Alphaproteobacteria bacterium]
MRILHIIHSVDPAGGGPVEGLIRQCEALPDCRCEVVTLDPPDAPFLKDFPLPLHALGVRTAKGRLSRFGYTPHLVPWLKGHAGDYDIAVVNGLWNYASAGSSRILPKLPVPYVVYPHGMMDPWFRKAYPAKHWLKQLFWTFFDGRLMEHARSALFTCEEEMILARGQFRGHPYRERVARYGCGAAPGDLGPPALDRPYLLFLGRLHPKKGCDLLIRAYAEVAPDIDLVMAGPDQVGWMTELQALAHRLGVGDRTHWPGLLTGPAKWGALKGAEAFILPSHQDSFGVAVGEALGCGTPALITDKVNIWREVRAGGAGLVETDSVAGIANMLRSYLALGKAERDEMRTAARACFAEHFDMNATAAKTLEIFRELGKTGA